MRTLKEIDNDLNEARSELSKVEGRHAEVYSRIVGYYRAVSNWNKGKREEYGERKLYSAEGSLANAVCCAARSARKTNNNGVSLANEDISAKIREFPVQAKTTMTAGTEEGRLLLFVRPNCPKCPAAKSAAGKLGIYVETVNADTETGLAEAAKRNVMSTPTAILLAKDGSELARARDAVSISKIRDFVPQLERKSA